ILSKRIEHARLLLALLDWYLSARGLGTIQYQVVRARANSSRIGLQQAVILRTRGGERMMGRLQRARLFVALEQRELGHPQELPLRSGDEPELLAQMQAQPGQHRVAKARGPEMKEPEVAFAGRGRAVDGLAERLRYHLERGLRPGAARAHLGARQAARAQALDHVLELVRLGARQFLSLGRRNPQSLDDATVGQ